MSEFMKSFLTVAAIILLFSYKVQGANNPQGIVPFWSMVGKLSKTTTHNSTADFNPVVIGDFKVTNDGAGHGGTVSADSIVATMLSISDFTTTNLTADYMDILHAIETLYLHATSADIDEVTANKANITYLNAGSADIDAVTTNKIVIIPSYIQPHQYGMLQVDSKEHELLWHSDRNLVKFSLGKDVIKRVFNQTLGTFIKGQAVSFSGGVGSKDGLDPAPVIQLCDSSTADGAKVEGLVIENITSNEYGYIIQKGILRGNTTYNFNTTSLPLGTKIYNDQYNPGNITPNPTTESGYYQVYIGVCLKNDPVYGMAYVNVLREYEIGTEDLDQITGWHDVDKSKTTVSINSGLKTVSLENPTSPFSFTYTIQGLEYSKTTTEVAVFNDTTGFKYAYLTTGGTFEVADTTSSGAAVGDSYSKCPVSFFYWNAEKQEYYDTDFRFLSKLDDISRIQFLLLNGMKYFVGSDISNYVVNGDGSSDTHAQFDTSFGVYYFVDNFSFATPTSQTFTNYFKDGASGAWTSATNSGFPVLTTGGGRLAYNFNDGGTWKTKEVPDGKFVNVFLIQPTLSNFNPITIMPIAYHDSIDDAIYNYKTEANTIISDSSIPFAAYKMLSVIVYETQTAFTNAVKARIVSKTNMDGDFIDLRRTSAGFFNLFTGLNTDTTITKEQFSVKEITTPKTPDSGYGSYYMKNGKPYFGTDTAEYMLAGGGGGSFDPTNDFIVLNEYAKLKEMSRDLIRTPDTAEIKIFLDDYTHFPAFKMWNGKVYGFTYAELAPTAPYINATENSSTDFLEALWNVVGNGSTTKTVNTWICSNTAEDHQLYTTSTKGNKRIFCEVVVASRAGKATIFGMGRDTGHNFVRGPATISIDANNVQLGYYNASGTETAPLIYTLSSDQRTYFKIEISGYTASATPSYHDATINIWVSFSSSFTAVPTASFTTKIPDSITWYDMVGGYTGYASMSIENYKAYDM